MSAEEIAEELGRLGSRARGLWLAEEGSTDGEALGRSIENLADAVLTLAADTVPRAPVEALLDAVNWSVLSVDIRDAVAEVRRHLDAAPRPDEDTGEARVVGPSEFIPKRTVLCNHTEDGWFFHAVPIDETTMRCPEHGLRRMPGEGWFRTRTETPDGQE